MRNTLLLLMLISLHTNAQNSVFNSSKPIIVRGKIENYHLNDKNGFVTLRTFHINGRGKDTAIRISPKGEFDATLFQPYEGDIGFMYNGTFLDLYAIPGETLKIFIDETAWNKQEDKSTAIRFEGKAAETSKAWVNWLYFRQSQKATIEADWSNKSLTDEDFARDRLLQLKEEKTWLKQFIEKENPSKAFIESADASLVYNAGFETTLHCFTGKMNKDMHDTTLIRMLKPYPLYADKLLKHSKYFSFLNLLSTDFQIIVNLNPAYTEQKRTLGKNPARIYLDLIIKYSQGLATQLMVYNLYNSLLPQFSEPYEAEFAALITDDFIESQRQHHKMARIKTFDSFDVRERILTAKSDDASKNRLAQLLEQKKDRYLFIDFWGSWCAPCMSEMPHYPAFMDSLKTLPIDFVFFSVDTKDDAVAQQNKKLGNQAIFINLTDNEARLMNNVFGFSSYPSHFMVGPGNKLLDVKIYGINNAGGVVNETLSRIRKAVK